MKALIQHPWLGNLWGHGQGLLVASIEVPTAIRPARNNGETDAEVLIYRTYDKENLLDLVNAAAACVQAALANLETIKAYAIEHAPADWRQHHQATDTTPLLDRLFLESVTIYDTYTEVIFDYGDLGLLVVQTDPSGHCEAVYLAP